jgi:hypothetical protein
MICKKNIVAKYKEMKTGWQNLVRKAMAPEGLSCE